VSSSYCFDNPQRTTLIHGKRRSSSIKIFVTDYSTDYGSPLGYDLDRKYTSMELNRNRPGTNAPVELEESLSTLSNGATPSSFQMERKSKQFSKALSMIKHTRHKVAPSPTSSDSLKSDYVTAEQILADDTKTPESNDNVIDTENVTDSANDSRPDITDASATDTVPDTTNDTNVIRHRGHFTEGNAPFKFI
jgi:hypothetical protein